MTEISPTRTITIDDNPSLARIDAFRRTMHDRIDKQQRVSGFHVDFNRAHDTVSRLLRTADSVLLKLGVIEVRFVAAGDHHRGTVARPNVRKRHQDVDLAA